MMPPGKTGENSRLLNSFREMCREVSEMPEPIIDLRSDTVTRPSPAMRRAIADAVVGDDVYHEDPTVNRLEATASVKSGTAGPLLRSPVRCTMAAHPLGQSRQAQVVSRSHHMLKKLTC